MAIMANEVLAELQIKQQEMIDILLKKVEVLEGKVSGVQHGSGSNNLRIQELESEVEHLKHCLEASVLVN